MSIRYEPSSWIFRLARAFGVVVLIAVVAAAAQAKPPSSSGGGKCNARKVTCSSSSDTRSPTVQIGSPVDGSTITGTDLLVSGTASDETTLVQVEVAIGGGPFLVATGTSSWSTTLDLVGLAAGSYSIEARARDAAGNVERAFLDVTLAVPLPSPEPTVEPTPEPTETPASTDLGLTERILSNDGVGQDMVPFGRGRMAVDGSRVALLYHTEFAQEPWAYIQDATTGASTHLRLPYDTVSGWGDASYALRGDSLWVLSGSGPIYVRHYRFTGSPLPGSAALVSSRLFGDTDSRPGDLIALASGALVGVWHQQGQTGPQGHRFVYRSADGAWSTTSIAFVPTSASKDVLVQHPADGSVWLFSNADSWSSIAAARLVETSASIRIDQTDAEFIDSAYGEFDADPENPALAVAPDPDRGEIVLAYQGATRYRFSSTVIGSHPVVARIASDGTKRFHQLKLWSERVARLGLVVAPTGVWLAHRVVDPGTLRSDRLSISRLAEGTWTTAEVGTLVAPYVTISFGVGTVQFAARMSDGRIHWFD